MGGHRARHHAGGQGHRRRLPARRAAGDRGRRARHDGGHPRLHLRRQPAGLRRWRGGHGRGHARRLPRRCARQGGLPAPAARGPCRRPSGDLRKRARRGPDAGARLQGHEHRCGRGRLRGRSPDGARRRQRGAHPARAHHLGGGDRRGHRAPRCRRLGARTTHGRAIAPSSFPKYRSGEREGADSPLAPPAAESTDPMNHFLDINKTDPADLRAIIDDANRMKTARGGRPKGAPDDTLPLKDRMVALIFEKPSTRTRVSFDVGVRQMGGQTMVLSGSEMQLGHGETIADTARVLSRYVDLIMIRTFEEDVLLELADYASVPVINGLTNRTHPCQIMADVMTYEEHRGPIAGKKVVWCGDGNNVFASFAHATAFPSGVSTMSVEATEQVGPIIVWRKDLREGSGGAGTHRGGLGQVIEIEARDGYDFHFNAMFDRVDNAARGRAGGHEGAAGRVELADGTRLKAKGRQHVAAGQRLRLSLPGGGGYGPPEARAREEVMRDLAAGYITADAARDIHGQQDEE